MSASDKQLATAYWKIKNRTREIILGVLFLILTLPAVVIAIALSIKLVRECPSTNNGFDYAAVGELLLVIVIGAGETIGFLGLLYIAREQNFDGWLKVQKLWTDSVFVDLRGKIFKRLDNLTAPWTEVEKRPPWTEAEHTDGEEVCRRMDEFAHLAAFWGFKKVLVIWDEPLARAWTVLEKIVNDEREKVKWPHKWMAFSTIGQKALDSIVRQGRDHWNRQPTVSPTSKNGATPMNLHPLFQSVIWPAVAGSVLWTFLQVAIDPNVIGPRLPRLAALLFIGVYLAIDWVNTNQVKTIKGNYWWYDMPLAASLATFAVATQFGARWATWPLAVAFAAAIIGHCFGGWDSPTSPSTGKARAILAVFNALGILVLLIGATIAQPYAVWLTPMAVLLVVVLFLLFQKKVSAH